LISLKLEDQMKQRTLLKKEKEFETTLNYLYQDGWGGLQHLYLDLSLNIMLRNERKLIQAVNSIPAFWGSVRYGWRTVYMSSLFRAYDHQGNHNIDRLLDLVENNLDLFSIEALSARKRRASEDADEWLPEYLKSAHVPNATDIKRLRKNAKKHQDRYRSVYQPIRNKVIFHRVVKSKRETKALYSKTNIRELQNLLAFLAKLHDALQGLYLNGRRPLLMPIPMSLKKIVYEDVARKHKGKMHVQSVADLKKALLAFDVGVTANMKY